MAPAGWGPEGAGGGGRSGGMHDLESAAVYDPDEEDDKLNRPCFEGYSKGAWWEVQILERRSDRFLIRFIGLGDEESEWVPLDFLRLRARRADAWDCAILRRGTDVSVYGVHPQAEGLRSSTAAALYDAQIVSVSKSKHQITDCSCTYSLKYFVIKDGTAYVHGVSRPLLTNLQAKEVHISSLRVLQYPGLIALNETLKAHISTKADDHRWSMDAFFLKETALKITSRREVEGSLTPRGDFLRHSKSHVANPSRRSGTMKDQHLGASNPFKSPDLETSPRLGARWADVAPKTCKRDVDEVDFREMKNPSKNNLKYHDRGMKRKYDSLEEKETSDIEDYNSRGASSWFPRSKDLAAGGSRRQDQNVGQRVASPGPETLHKAREPLDFKRNLKIADSESSPDENLPESSEDLNGDSGHSSGRGSSHVAVLERRRREDEEPGKAERHHERRSSRHEPHKSYGTSKHGPSPDMAGRHWQKEDKDTGTYYTQKTEKRNLAGKDSKVDHRDEDNSGRKRGRPRKYTRSQNGKGYEWKEEPSPKDAKDNLGRGKHSKEPEYKKSGSPKAKWESPNKVSAFGEGQGMETGRERNRREKGKLSEKIVTKRSSERLQKTSPVKPMGKEKGFEKVDKDPGSAKTGVHLSSPSPNSEDPTSEIGSQQLKKLRPRIPLKSKNSLPKRDVEKEKVAKEKVVERPLYVDLLVNNDDDCETKPRPTDEQRPDFGLNDSWDPVVEDIPSDDSDCNIMAKKEPLPKTLWQEFEETAPAVGSEQALPPTFQEAARPEVDKADGDIKQINCEHKNLELKDDVGYVCSNCGLISEAIEDVVPQVEFPHRRPREADLDEWDFDRYSPDGNQGPVGYDQIKDGEVVTMLSTSLPPHYAQQMHPHQKDGFEFLWRNLGYDAEGNVRSKKADRNSGCILSHAPGTGKSFLIISFLKSYLDKFPNCHPLIVAPKIMLLRWQKEFARWKSDIQVFILNTALTYGKRFLRQQQDAGLVSVKSNQTNSRTQSDTLSRMAVLFQWRQVRSVCLVSYNLFSALTDEEGSNRTQEGEAVRKCLLDSPGILILDEGHFPRNKDTRIRKALMKVKTNARVLLSGTLFQNNFEELFNTLYLVRPGFVEAFSSCDLGLSSDVVRNKFDEKRADDHPAMEEVTVAAERKARKLFVEEIGMKIEEGQLQKGSEVVQHEAKTGLQMLQRLTANFVHHHTGEVLACLPGLRDFGILLKPTSLQCSLLKVLEERFQRPEEYLKREIAVSEASIHPKLVTKLDFVNREFVINALGADGAEMSALFNEPSKAKDGVKTKFVFDLLENLRSTSEKVLIFSQHMAPLEMLEDMFKQSFNWDKNKDVLRLDGNMVMNDREAVIERFNDPSSQVQVLLASTKACGEGINLVGASRVVFLDVLWNPAVIKQAISRAFRLGQKKIVYVYRLIARETIEEKKYKKAIRKDWLSMSIFTPPAGEVVGVADEQIEDVLVNPPESISSKTQSGRENIRAWEVDASTCEDNLLEKLLNLDKSRANSFVKVVEHGSQFHHRKTPCGPDAREWFLEDCDYKDLSRTRETREGEGLGVEDPRPATKLYQDFTECGAFDTDAVSSSDTDEEIL